MQFNLTSWLWGLSFFVIYFYTEMFLNKTNTFLIFMVDTVASHKTHLTVLKKKDKTLQYAVVSTITLKWPSSSEQLKTQITRTLHSKGNILILLSTPPTQLRHKLHLTCLKKIQRLSLTAKTLRIHSFLTGRCREKKNNGQTVKKDIVGLLVLSFLFLKKVVALVTWLQN